MNIIKLRVKTDYCYGKVERHTKTLSELVKVANMELSLTKNIRKFIVDRLDDDKPEWSLMYIRQNGVSTNKYKHFNRHIRAEINEYVYNEFKNDIDMYIIRAKELLNVELPMDTYTMFVKFDKAKKRYLKKSDRLVKKAKIISNMIKSLHTNNDSVKPEVLKN